MYAFTIDHVMYDAHRDGTPITLVDAVRAAHGTRGVTVRRLDGTPVLRNAGSDTRHGWKHEPSGRPLRRAHPRTPRWVS